MKLTPRECEVMTLVADGFIDKEIASQLSLSPRTVQTHIMSVIKKYDARNRTHAAILFMKNSIVVKYEKNNYTLDCRELFPHRL